MRENLPALVEQAEDVESGRSHLPGFVLRELEAYVGCGLLSRGFLRAVCETCKQSVLVAFSCQCRGFCPACCTRRMEDTTEHVIERVLPDVPIRQWVLSLPFPLRHRVAFEAELFAEVIRIFLDEVFRTVKEKARASGLAAPKCGGIAFLQRFGSALTANPHIHAVILDGAYEATAANLEAHEPLVFHPVSAPSAAEVTQVSIRVCRRVVRLLERRGVVDAEGLFLEAERPPEAVLHETAARVVPLFARVDGEGRVHPVRKSASVGQAGEHRGFSTHAGVSARGGDKAGRTRIVRYCVRPPFAEKQVSATRDGRVAFELRRPRANGATHIVLNELGFLRRLAALIPPPRQHQARYFGVLASASPLRPCVVPRAPLALALSNATAATTDAPKTSARKRTDWAALLARVYGFDALLCPKCNGRLRIIAALTEPKAVRQILEHLGLDDEPPPKLAQAPPDAA